MVACNSCLTHGIIQDNTVIIPCLYCAASTNWNWNGQTCYGSASGEELSGDDYVEHVYDYFHHLVPFEDIFILLPPGLKQFYITHANYRLFMDNKEDSDYASSSSSP